MVTIDFIVVFLLAGSTLEQTKANLLWGVLSLYCLICLTLENASRKSSLQAAFEFCIFFLSEFQQKHLVKEISRGIIFSESKVIDTSVKSIGRAHTTAKSAVQSGQSGKELGEKFQKVCF